MSSYTPAELAQVDQTLAETSQDVSRLSGACYRGDFTISVDDVDELADSIRQLEPETVAVMLAVALIRLGRANGGPK